MDSSTNPLTPQTGRLKLAVTARALFDLTEASQVYAEEGLESYIRFMARYQQESAPPLAGGPAMGLAKRLGALHDPETGSPLAEIILVSQNHAHLGPVFLRAIEVHDLPVTQVALTGGAPQTPYLTAFGADLFLSFNGKDVAEALARGIPAALLYHQWRESTHTGQVRVAFDGDAVLFSAASEAIFAAQGLEGFLTHEWEHRHEPMSAGPFLPFLRKLHEVQRKFIHLPPSQIPIRTALITARGAAVLDRPLLTLAHFGVSVDEAVAMDGRSKTAAIEAFAPHIFFDDRATYVEGAATVTTGGQVPILDSTPPTEKSS